MFFLIVNSYSFNSFPSETFFNYSEEYFKAKALDESKSDLRVLFLLC